MIQIVVGWGLQIVAPDQALKFIGAIPCGDIIITVLVIYLSYIFIKFKAGPIEAMIRKFESLFIVSDGM